MTERVLSVVDGRVSGLMTAEELARDTMGEGPTPYVNLLHLNRPRRRDGMSARRWGEGEFLISGDGRDEALYEL